MSASADSGGERRFTPTSGTGAGWFGLVLAGLVLVVVLVDDRSVPTIRFAFVTAMFGLLVWCYMLRPRVVIGTREVELRNAFSSWHVPLAEVRRVSVRAVTHIHTDDGRFDGVAVGRPVRSLRGGRTSTRRAVGLTGLGATYTMDQNAKPKGPQGDLDADGVADFVTEQILLAADRARAEPADDRGPRRTWATWELSGLVLLAVAVVVSFFS
ncbi:hypothetical protein ACVW00_001117 [Marmoricola sp. URHA0025 HA25]